MKRAVSMLLCTAAALAAMSVCSAQSIEITELTDESLQIDGTVMYVDGTNEADRVTVEEYPLAPDFIMVRVWDAENVVVWQLCEMDSLEAVIVSLGAGADDYDNDTIVRDVVHGGTGNDTVFGGRGVSWLYGEGGEDLLNGQLGNDIVNGGDDADWVIADADFDDNGDDILIGGAGNDNLYAYSGRNWLFGGAGADHLYGSVWGLESLFFGEEDDDAIDAGHSDTAYGGSGADTISAGNVYGGAGDDRITGTSLSDVLIGEDGNDTIIGLGDADFLNGGPGRDMLYGDYAYPQFDTSGGNDVIHGGSDADFLWGEFGNDTLFGDDGDDGINGGRGNDTLRGGRNNDTLTGGVGLDTLYGDEGNDSLIGGSGSFDGLPDTLWGNAGADKFKRAFKPGLNPPVWEDTLADYNAGQGDTTY